VAEEVPIEVLLERAGRDPEQHLDPDRVERYAGMLDDLPPVTVFRLPGGLLLVDGYHRLAAARRLGRTTVPAEVRTGSETDALRFAAAHAAGERGVSEEDARDAIRRWSGAAWGDAEGPPQNDR
jgi:hypothetical protein